MAACVLSTMMIASELAICKLKFCTAFWLTSKITSLAQGVLESLHLDFNAITARGQRQALRNNLRNCSRCSVRCQGRILHDDLGAG